MLIYMCVCVCVFHLFPFTLLLVGQLSRSLDNIVRTFWGTRIVFFVGFVTFMFFAVLSLNMFNSNKVRGTTSTYASQPWVVVMISSTDCTNRMFKNWRRQQICRAFLLSASTLLPLFYLNVVLVCGNYGPFLILNHLILVSRCRDTLGTATILTAFLPLYYLTLCF